VYYNDQTAKSYGIRNFPACFEVFLLFNAGKQTTKYIENCVKFYNEKSCVKLQPKKTGETHYVKFIVDEGC